MGEHRNIQTDRMYECTMSGQMVHEGLQREEGGRKRMARGESGDELEIKWEEMGMNELSG